MGSNDHIDFELHELITDAIDAGYLEEGTAAAGIAKLAVDIGYENLSPKQQGLYNAVVLPALRKREESLEKIRFANMPD